MGSISNMPLLPFRPPPYPDELLCSWLARLAHHNGSGSWRPLIEAVCHNRRLQNPMLGMVDYSDEIEQLLKTLGTNYLTAMMDLTTLPYWLAFDAPESLFNTSSTSNPVDQLRIQAKKRISHGIHKVGARRPSGSARTARLCPLCLEEDCTNYGEPYWHRAHQLPNVFICASHGCALLDACPECNQTIVPLASRLLDLPKLRCSCGYSLNKAQQPDNRSPFPLAYMRLVNTSIAALNNGYPKWSYAEMRHYLKLSMNEKERGPSSYKRILCHTFDLDGTQVGSPLTLLVNNKSIVTLVPFFSMARSPDLCALMVALDLSFRQASRELTHRAFSSPPLKKERRKWFGATLSPKVARHDMLNFMASRGGPPARHKVIYWYLKLFDRDWLDKNFVVHPVEIPSVAADRAYLRQVLAQGSISKIREKFRNTPAGIRASLRDQSWLADRLSELNAQAKESQTKQHGEGSASRSSLLQSALQRVLATEHWPVRINGPLLGQMVGLSGGQAQVAIRRDPELRQAIEAANQNKTERQIIFATRQLYAEGHPISLKQILRRARVPSRRENFQMAEQARDGLLGRVALCRQEA